jgi:hypothetical protein
VNLTDNFVNAFANKSMRGAPPPNPQNPRPEMRGPSDISNILSGLKTKSINIPSGSGGGGGGNDMTSLFGGGGGGGSANNTNNAEEKGSTISISELKDLQNDNMPSRTKRKPKSEKNTISLDI